MISTITLDNLLESYSKSRELMNSYCKEISEIHKEVINGDRSIQTIFKFREIVNETCNELDFELYVLNMLKILGLEDADNRINDVIKFREMINASTNLKWKS